VVPQRSPARTAGSTLLGSLGTETPVTGRNGARPERPGAPAQGHRPPARRRRRNGARPERPGAHVEGNEVVRHTLAATEPGQNGREHLRDPRRVAVGVGAATEPGQNGREHVQPTRASDPGDVAATEPGQNGREHLPPELREHMRGRPQRSPARTAGSTRRPPVRRVQGSSRNGARPERPGAPAPASPECPGSARRNGARPERPGARLDQNDTSELPLCGAVRAMPFNPSREGAVELSRFACTGTDQGASTPPAQGATGTARELRR